MVWTASLQLPPAVPAMGGFAGSCYIKGNMLLSHSRSSRGSLSGTCGFFRVVNGGCLHADGLIKLEAHERHCVFSKSSFKYTTSCFLSADICFDYFDPTKKSNRSHSGGQVCSGKRSMRHIAVRSDLVQSGTPGTAFPFEEVSFGSKARGICFYVVTAAAAMALFGLMVVAHPFVLSFDRYRRRAHHLIAKTWATLTVLPFFKVEFEGLEHLPKLDTPAVFVSNHQSFLDIYTLLTLGRSFKFISKTSIFLYPVIGWAMFLMGVIPLKRMDNRSQLECLKRCMDLIRGGASVFFFPEGTRSKDGKLGAFKKGAFSVAAKTEVPVVPMTIMGTGSIMPAGNEGILNPGSVKVVIHPCLKGKDAQVLCNQARSVIADTLDRQG